MRKTIVTLVSFILFQICTLNLTGIVTGASLIAAPIPELQVATFEINSFSETDLFAIPYGYKASEVEIHGYLAVQYFDYQTHALGSYANEGGSSTQHTNIIPYSGYINLSSKLNL